MSLFIVFFVIYGTVAASRKTLASSLLSGHHLSDRASSFKVQRLSPMKLSFAAARLSKSASTRGNSCQGQG